MTPRSTAVSTTVTEIIAPNTFGQKRGFLVLGRQDTDTRLVCISFGERLFAAANAAFWIGPGERHVITPDQGLWDLVNQGVYGVLASGADINVQVQAG